MGARLKERRRTVVGHLFTKKTLPIGVDLGAEGVRLLQLAKQHRAYSVVAADHLDLGAELLDAPREERMEWLAKTVGERLERCGFRGRRCVLSVDDELLRVRSIRQPPMPEEETNRALRLEGGERLGLPEDEAAEVGWLRAGEVRQGEDLRDELIVVGAGTSSLEELVDLFAGAGLRPIALEPRFIGLARAFGRTLRRAVDQSTVRLVVNIGSRTTGVIVMRGQEVVFYKLLQIGGEQMTTLAAETLGLARDAAWDLRRRRMRKMAGEKSVREDDKVDRAIFDAIRPTLDELANEVALCMRYYTVTYRGDRPRGALIAGRDAAEPGLTELISETLSVPVEIGKPLEGVDVTGASTVVNRRTPMAEWAVATGLSLAGDASLAAPIEADDEAGAGEASAEAGRKERAA